MNIDSAEDIVKSIIVELIKEENGQLSNIEVKNNTPLIGGEAELDSMKLVEICLALEEKAEDLGFEFDWTSSNAMSKSQSMFRTVSSLAKEFLKQSNRLK